VSLAAGLLLGFSPLADAQTRRPAPARPAPARPAPAATLRTEPAMLMCPSVLGEGVQTKRSFCDVLIGRDPAGGVIVTLPPHTGDVTLTFDLHNRHLYSEELVKTNRAYRQYTATVGVLTADNTLLSRAVIRSEFRTATDLLDRISGETGPGSVKAVAPTGSEPVRITIPKDELSVSILGEKLTMIRPDGTDNFSAPGRPVAVISNVMLEYKPPPPPRRRTTRRK
jgi:hypothetical protein